MDDLIRRQDAVNELSYCQTYLFDSRDHDKKISLEDAEYTIERLPSAQQWIPCSERLPNYDEEVLVDYHGKVRLASLTKNDEEYPWYFIVNRFNAKLETVRAWMPLPEPYREEVSD